jgi:hypothetical protein
MSNLNGFNANEIDPSFGFEPIPAGKYLAAITDSQLKPTKKGNGSYLELTFQVLEGEYKERQVWSRLNLENPNATSVKMARGELSAICRAVNVMRPNDAVELHNIPMVITVAVKKRNDSGDLTNVIKAYAKKDAMGPGSTPSGGKPPWQK